MIDVSDYKLPKQEQPKKKPKADHATFEYMKSLPWRPFDVEW